MNDYPLNVGRVRLRMYHTDLTGVFHGRAFEIFEDARTEVFRTLGFEYAEVLAAGLGMIAVRVAAQFHRPLRIVDGLLEVSVFIAQLTGARIDIEYEVREAGAAAIAIQGHTLFAFMDMNRGRPVPVPAGIIAAVERCPAMLRPGVQVSHRAATRRE